MTKLFVKNMVCNRCIMVVEEELKKLGFAIREIRLGEVVLDQELQNADRKNIEEAFEKVGFELINDKKSQLIEKTKNVIIRLIHQNEEEDKRNVSTILSEEVYSDYSYLSTLFSETEGITIEKYVIAQKVEKVKELLVYDELTMDEIADKLGYSSVAYLSNQFKKSTGLTPSYFKKIGREKRRSIDSI